MRLDQLAMDVDPDQGAVRADLNLHADIPTRRHRIQSAIQPHMVIGVNLAVDPVGWIETSALSGIRTGFSSLLKTSIGTRRVVPWIRRPAVSRHQTKARRATSSRSMKVSPLKKRSRTKRTVFSTTGLSLGCRGRAASGRKPR